MTRSADFERRVARIGLTVSLALPALFGCKALYDRANVPGLEDAVMAGFEYAGLPPPELSCTMHGRTRAGRCKLEAEASDILELVKALKLEPVALKRTGPEDDTRIRGFRFSLESGRAPCSAEEGFSFAELSAAYFSGRREAHMRSATRSTLEYFAVVQRKGSDVVCIELEYAYG